MTVQPPAAQPSAKMELGVYVSKAWDLMKANALLLIVTYLIAAIIAGIPLVGLIIGGPVMFGFVRIIQKRYKGEPAEIGQVFDGFKTDFSKGLVTFLLLAAVSLCVAIPAIIIFMLFNFLIPCVGTLLGFLIYIAAILAIGTALYFVLPIAALSDAAPVDAIKKGFKFMTANIGPMILLVLVTGLISMAGVIACGIGVWFTAPMSMAIVVIAYNEWYLPNAPAA
jgi:MFS family permease